MESLKQFHAILSGLAARCFFGALETRVLREVFIVNMTNRKAQNESCRDTKTPEEAYRIALCYERRKKIAKMYVLTGGTASTSSTTSGGMQINTKPLGVI